MGRIFRSFLFQTTLFFLLGAPVLFALDRITLEDGTEILAKIVAQNRNAVTYVSGGKTNELGKNEIRKINLDVSNDRYWEAFEEESDPATRLILVEKSVSNFPSEKYNRLALSRFYLGLMRVQEAVEILSAFPDEPEFKLLKAYASLKKGDPKPAQKPLPTSAGKPAKRIQVLHKIIASFGLADQKKYAESLLLFSGEEKNWKSFQDEYAALGALSNIDDYKKTLATLSYLTRYKSESEVLSLFPNLSQYYRPPSGAAFPSIQNVRITENKNTILLRQVFFLSSLGFLEIGVLNGLFPATPGGQALNQGLCAVSLSLSLLAGFELVVDPLGFFPWQHRKEHKDLWVQFPENPGDAKARMRTLHQAIFLFGGSAVSGAAFAVFAANYTQKRAAYNALPKTAAATDFNNAASDMTAFAVLSLISAEIAAGLLWTGLHALNFYLQNPFSTEIKGALIPVISPDLLGFKYVRTF